MPRVEGSRLSAPDAFAVTSPRADPRQPPALAHVRRFRLRRLKHEIRAAIAEGLTPLVLDSSDDHVVDTFFSFFETFFELFDFVFILLLSFQFCNSLTICS